MSPNAPNLLKGIVILAGIATLALVLAQRTSAPSADDFTFACGISGNDPDQSQPEFDLGAIPAASVQRVAVDVTNNTSSELRIERFVHSCSCTHLEQGFTRLQPDATGRMSFNFNIPPDEIDASNSVEMQYALVGASGQGRSFKMRFRFRSARLLTSAPDPFLLGKVTRTSGLLPELIVTRGSMPMPFADVVATTTLPGTVVDVTRLNEDQWRIQLVPNAPFVSGALVGEVRVAPVLAAGQVGLKVPCMGVVIGRLNIAPAVVFFGTLRSGAATDLEFRITPAESTVFTAPVGASMVGPNPDADVIAISPVQDAKSLNLRIRLHPTDIGAYEKLTTILVRAGGIEERLNVMLRGQCTP